MNAWSFALKAKKANTNIFQRMVTKMKDVKYESIDDGKFIAENIEKCRKWLQKQHDDQLRTIKKTIPFDEWAQLYAKYLYGDGPTYQFNLKDLLALIQGTNPYSFFTADQIKCIWKYWKKLKNKGPNP